MWMANIYQISNGTWRCRIAVGKNPKTGKYEYKSKSGFKTEDDAKAYADKVENKKYQEKFSNFKNATLSDYSKLIEEVNEKYVDLDEYMKMHLALEILKIEKLSTKDDAT